MRIAPAMLPHLAGRALTRKRYPNGVDAEFFYEKNAPQHRPDWVKTAPIWSEGQSPHGALHSGERFADACLVGKSGRDRVASVAGFGERHHLPDP